jgi:osmotically-inducible protein OsmY
MKTDFELRHDVERELEEDPSVDARDVAVTAKNGVVTLTGQVPTLGEKWRAESVAKRVAGVVAIANEIEVELMHERTDADIAEDLRLAFKMDNRIPADSIKVAVSNGWVTLEGTVNHHFQKVEAESLARELAGVRGITNKIEVTPSASPKDVKARIEDAFKRSAQLDANRISVESLNGKVILTGTVRSFAERGEAEAAAWRTPGVTEVENKLIVKP